MKFLWWPTEPPPAEVLGANALAKRRRLVFKQGEKRRQQRDRVWRKGLRHGRDAKYRDAISRLDSKYSRHQVPEWIMDEIGYEDCDWLSQESRWQFWRRFQNWTVEFHLPCRDPIDHLLSMCNRNMPPLDCRGDLVTQLDSCIKAWRGTTGTITDKLSSDEFPSARLRCYNFSMAPNYVEYMGTLLQKKKRQAEHLYRPTSEPRDVSTECLLHNATARAIAEQHLKQVPYYAFCSRCLGSWRDLLR